MKSIKLHCVPTNTPDGNYYFLKRFIDEPLKLTMLETLQYAEENEIWASFYGVLPLNPASSEELIKIANGEIKQKRRGR